MDKFDPDHWAESYHIPDIPEVPLTGKIFKLAATLYTLMSLSISSPDLYPITLGPGKKKLYWEDRRLMSSELLALLVESRKYIKCDVTLFWPMVVAGTFLVDGTKEDQELLLGLVRTIDCGPASTNSHFLIAKTLEDFWASGKVEWDDCWFDDGFFLAVHFEKVILIEVHSEILRASVYIHTDFQLNILMNIYYSNYILSIT